MQNHEIEALARDALQRANSKAPTEDSRVELKSEFIDPAKAARRLAAHANASAYEPIIWIFGAKEDGSLVGAERTDFASWFARVAKCFNGVPPRPKEVSFSIGDKTIMAVAFETDAPPYVVSNPDGGKIAFEVPWREATSTRTANRAELLQILVPQIRIPKVEILKARVVFERARQNFQNERYSATAQLDLYFAQLSSESIALPTHKVRIEFDIGNGHGSIALTTPHFFGDGVRRSGVVGSSLQPRESAQVDGVESTMHEAIIRGFGRMSLRATAEGTWGPKFFADICTLKATCGLAGDHRAIVLVSNLKRTSGEGDVDQEWLFRSDPNV